MARDITDYNGSVVAPNSDYPNGRIKDDTGSQNGTVIDEQSNGDVHQYFAKTMRDAGIVYNNLPDNEYSGNQLYQAATKTFRSVGDYLAWDRSSSIILSGNYNIVVEILAGSPDIGVVTLEDTSFSLFDFGTVTIVNLSSFTCPINAAGGDTINGASSYDLDAGKLVQFAKIKSAAKYLIIAST